MTYQRSLSKPVSFAKRERLPVGDHLAWKIHVGYLRAIALSGTEYPKTLGIWGRVNMSVLLCLAGIPAS